MFLQTLVSAGPEMSKVKDKLPASRPSNGAKIKPVGHNQNHSTPAEVKKTKAETKKVSFSDYYSFNSFYS